MILYNAISSFTGSSDETSCEKKINFLFTPIAKRGNNVTDHQFNDENSVENDMHRIIPFIYFRVHLSKSRGRALWMIARQPEIMINDIVYAKSNRTAPATRSIHISLLYV